MSEHYLSTNHTYTQSQNNQYPNTPNNNTNNYPQNHPNHPCNIPNGSTNLNVLANATRNYQVLDTASQFSGVTQTTGTSIASSNQQNIYHQNFSQSKGGKSGQPGSPGSANSKLLVQNVGSAHSHLGLWRVQNNNRG